MSILAILLFLFTFLAEPLYAQQLGFEVTLEPYVPVMGDESIVPDDYVVYVCNKPISKDFENKVTCDGHMQQYVTTSLEVSGFYHVPGTGEQEEAEVIPSSVTALSNLAGREPGHSIDNNTDTYWSSSSSAASPTWIAYDFGVNVRPWVIDISWHDGNTRAFSFDIEGSLDGVSWYTLLASSVSNGTTSGPERYILTEVLARHLRINGYGNTVSDFTSIIEVDVYVRDGLIEVIPSSVTALSNLAGREPGHSIDNNITTYWSSDSSVASPTWIAYDFGVNVRPWVIDISWHDGDNRAFSFDIEGSLDSATWYPLLASSTSSGTTTQLERYILPDILARHLRINGYGNTVSDFTSIIEVDIYEK